MEKPAKKKREEVKIDLSEVSKLRDDLRQRTEELEACTKELEAWTWAIFHDLRAPLISVQGFANLLVKKYRDRLDEKGIEYLDRLKREADRLDELLQDLANKSRGRESEE